MYFVNLLDPRYKGEETAVEGIYTRKGKRRNGLPLILDPGFDFSEGFESDIAVYADNTGLHVGYQEYDADNNPIHENLFSANSDSTEPIFPCAKKDTPVLWKDVVETPSNPLILVLCKSIGLKNGAKTCLKYININENVCLAMLVSGFCIFEDYEGSYLPMSRCLDEDFSRMKSEMISPSRLLNMTNVVHSNGYDFCMDMLMTVFALYSKDTLSFKLNRKESVIFDPNTDARVKERTDLLEKQQEAKEAEKARKAAEAEENRKILEEERQEREERERMLAEARKAAKKNSSTRAPRKPRAESSGEGADKRNLGAVDFLSLLQNM